jgi:1-phosphofructokinase family hexose kinase
VIVTVTPNPALDLTYQIPELRAGETLRVPAPAARAGGKGVNVARVIRQAGREARAVLTAGGPRGEALRRDLADSGIPAVVVPTTGESRATVTIVEEGSGAATVLAEEGAPLAPAETAALQSAAIAELRGASALVISGSLAPGIPAGFAAELVREARAAGVPCVVDAVGEALALACAAGAHAVKPNRDELAATTSTTDPLAGAEALVELGAGIVFVSLGAEGLLAVSRHGRLRAALREPLTGNPTGAGDAAVAAIADAFAGGVDELSELVRRAALWSSAAVAMPLAGEIDLDLAGQRARVTITEA